MDVFGHPFFLSGNVGALIFLLFYW